MASETEGATGTAEQRTVRELNSKYGAHRPAIYNHNSNANYSYGPVQTINNNNPVTNYLVYGDVPKDTVRSAIPF